MVVSPSDLEVVLEGDRANEYSIRLRVGGGHGVAVETWSEERTDEQPDGDVPGCETCGRLSIVDSGKRNEGLTGGWHPLSDDPIT